jgi:hypothetical protein
MVAAAHHIDPRLKDFATPAQARNIDAINEHGGADKAARALGIDTRGLRRSIVALKKAAAIKGYSPEHDMTHTVPDGFKVKGVSTYYNKDGVAAGQWVKTATDADRAEAIIREFTEWLAEHGARDMAPATEAPTMVDDDLLSVYPMGDPHFGLYAWAAESGEDFDLDIAEKVTCKAVDRLVASAPNAKRALLLNLGDFTHADDSSNLTPGHGNQLDVDTRYGKVAQVGLRALIHCVRRLLEKHEEVDVWMMPGNHDPHVSFMLALCLDAFFNSEQRVTVDLSPSLYRYMRFGQVLIGSHHGHGAKSGDLPLLMAADRPEDWGQTVHRYMLCGHIHHWTAKEHPGVIVETFRTLAAKDAWHAGKGYRSGRDMNVITYHKKHGELQRTRCDIGMLAA